MQEKSKRVDLSERRSGVSHANLANLASLLKDDVKGGSGSGHKGITTADDGPSPTSTAEMAGGDKVYRKKTRKKRRSSG